MKPPGILAALSLALVAPAPAAAPTAPPHAPAPAPEGRAGAQQASGLQEVDAARKAEARTALEAVAERLADVGVFRAAYVQERTSPLLVEPLVSKGVLYQRTEPACLVFHAETPYSARIRVDTRTYQVHRPDEGTAERFVFEGDHAGTALLGALRPDPDALFAAFVLIAVEAEEGALTLSLRPRDPGMRKHVDHLSLRLDTEAHLASCFGYVDREGHRVTLRLSERELDPELSDAEREALFSPRLPDGVELLVHRVTADR